MSTKGSRVDGNAAAGVLGEVFALEATSADGECAGCGAVRQIGACHVYLDAPGIVVRCPSCDAVLLRVVERRHDLVLDVRGLVWIQLAR